MARIAALGEERRIEAFAIAGVDIHDAATDADAVAAWSALAPDVAVLILTPRAHRVLESRLDERRDLLVTVLP